MEQKFFYFGVRMKEVVVDATSTPRQREVVRWAPKVYNSAAEAAAAAANAMVTRLGVSFFIQGFNRELDIDNQGVSKGFKGINKGFKAQP